MDVGEFGGGKFWGGEFGAEEVDWGLECCASRGFGWDLVRKCSIQEKCSFKAMVCF